MAKEDNELIKDLTEVIHEYDKLFEFNTWIFNLIKIIANSNETDAIICEEIKCVCRKERQYREAFENGTTPEDYWQGELQAILDSL